MIVGILLFLFSVLLLITGSIKPILVISCLLFAFSIVLYELIVLIRFRKHQSFLRKQYGVVLAEPFFHLMGFPLAHMQTIFIMITSDKFVRVYADKNWHDLEINSDTLVVYVSPKALRHMAKVHGQVGIDMYVKEKYRELSRFVLSNGTYKWEGLLILHNPSQTANESSINIALRPFNQNSIRRMKEILNVKDVEFLYQIDDNQD